MDRKEIESLNVQTPYSFETDREEQWYQVGVIEGLEAADNDPNVGISVHTDMDGVKWVRVKIFDEDFLIAAKDYEEEGENYFSWRKAVEIGTFSKKQAYLIAAYKEEIEKLLEEIGGDPLASYYWSSAEDSTNYAWGVGFSNGYVYTNYKYSTYLVRPCKAFKDRQ